MFCLNNYDCIGFDLDCTLAEYNLNEITELIYKLLTDFLVEKKSYSRECLLKPLHVDKHLMQKGLFMDLNKGNILKLNHKGTIIKATHGTCILKEESIIKQYGKKKTFGIIQDLIVDPLCILKPPSENVLRTTLDCFDIPCIILFARLVDHCDKHSEETSLQYSFWPDILEGLYYIYSFKNLGFEGGFFSAIKKNPSKYYKKWESKKLDWLANIKKKKFVFLLTGSFIEFAECTASYCIGENWKDYFDIILCYAKKPNFFSGNQPFKKVENEIKMELRNNDALNVKATYCQGNWKDFSSFLLSTTNILNPKCLYIGDNLLQDIFAPVKFDCCDTVAVIPELKFELIDPNILWGHYLEESNEHTTFWNNIIRTHAKICVSSLDVFLNKTIDTEFQCLEKKKSDLSESSGYYIA